MGKCDTNPDLHGNVPDTSPVALLLLDVITDFEFPDGDTLLAQATKIAPRLQKLVASARAASIPILYVNDNFGRWRNDFRRLVERCIAPGAKGRAFVEGLLPDKDDYFVLKPKHSGFYGTTLALLLEYVKAKTLIITGLTGNMCVLFTAQDAYVRDFCLAVPSDCLASVTDKANDLALRHMHEVLKADIAPSDRLNLSRLRAGE